MMEYRWQDVLKATAAKACKNHRFGHMKLIININFLDQDSLSSTNDHLVDFDETPSPLSGAILLSDHKWIFG